MCAAQRQGKASRGSPLRRGDTQRGFTYLWLLATIALTAAGLAQLGQSWRQRALKEQQVEQQFRGEAIARAIASYVAVGGVYPNTLEDLLRDERGPKPRAHLRRCYADPLTGTPDWELLPAQTGKGFAGVRSRVGCTGLKSGAREWWGTSVEGTTQPTQLCGGA